MFCVSGYVGGSRRETVGSATRIYHFRGEVGGEGWCTSRRLYPDPFILVQTKVNLRTVQRREGGGNLVYSLQRRKICWFISGSLFDNRLPSRDGSFMVSTFLGGHRRGTTMVRQSWLDWHESSFLLLQGLFFPFARCSYECKVIAAESSWWESWNVSFSQYMRWQQISPHNVHVRYFYSRKKIPSIVYYGAVKFRGASSWLSRVPV